MNPVCDGSAGDCERRGKQIERLVALLREAIGFSNVRTRYDVYPAYEGIDAMEDWRRRAKAEVC